MEDIIISDLSQPEHGQAVLDLLTEYAHGDTGGGCCPGQRDQRRQSERKAKQRQNPSCDGVLW